VLSECKIIAVKHAKIPESPKNDDDMAIPSGNDPVEI
jgi:hypothetical protein